VNQRLPSEPEVLARAPPGTVKEVNTPAGVIRQTVPLPSVIQRLPSGPRVMETTPPSPGRVKYVTVPFGASLAMSGPRYSVK
jgi:hypothetical protein